MKSNRSLHVKLDHNMIGNGRLDIVLTLSKVSEHFETLKWWISKHIVFVSKKCHKNATFLVTKTICFEIYHLSVSKCSDTLERVKTMSNLPFPIILWSNFSCQDISDSAIYDNAFS